jgi:hypothetical protein
LFNWVFFIELSAVICHLIFCSVVCSIDVLNCRHCSWHWSTHQQVGELPMDYHREIVNFNAYRMDLCTLPIVKPVWMSMMAMLAWVNFSRIDNTLWSREKCLASQSLHIRCSTRIYVQSIHLKNIAVWSWELYILLLQCFHSSITGRTVTPAEIDGLAIDA